MLCKEAFLSNENQTSLYQKIYAQTTAHYNE